MLLQVLQRFAKDEGFSFETRTQNRVSWRRDAHGNVVRLNPISKIKKLRDDMVKSEEIDAGELICPTERTRNMLVGGELIVSRQLISGRKLSLQRIRLMHLQLTKDYIRKTDTTMLSTAELSEMMVQRGSKFS